MTAAKLRAAASLIRERAEAATPGPWRQHTAKEAADTVVFATVAGKWVTNVENCHKVGEHVRVPGGEICTDQAVPNGDHIASWHPAVALAVADLLDAVSCSCPPCSCCGAVIRCEGCEPITAALAVANAYLGGEQR